MDLDLDPFFNPKSIALVGASNNISSWGFIVAHNIIQNNYTGSFYPINPSSNKILGYTAYPTILDVPQKVKIDLVIIIIPAAKVLSILKQMARRNIHHVVIISGGFKESGEEGELLEQDVYRFAKKNHIRIIGPNGMGIVSTRVNLTAVMWPVKELKQGGLAFISQSGNIGTIGISVASRRGIGLNTYVSAGNMVDLTITDYLEYFGKYDKTTQVIGLYVEGIQDARRFASLVKEISKIKPVIILKAGGTKAGRRAAHSHTGAITGDDAVFKNILQNAGSIIVNSLEEMFDLFLAFSNWVDWTFPRGKVVILTLGGGWGVMAADECSRHGITLETLSEKAFEKINALLPPFWSKGNPIDTVASLNLDSLREIMLIVFEEMPQVEAILLLGIGGFSFLANLAKSSPLIPEDDKANLDFIIQAEVELFKEILALSNRFQKPVLITTLLVPADSPGVKYLQSQNYPLFSSPAKMVQVFRYMVNHFKWKNRI
ncbi:MAG: acetate--CoA ligase family protein [Candidatus Hodarchaeales archaeon]|jgi:acyl-CoA synthetase (NDP forming)